MLVLSRKRNEKIISGSPKQTENKNLFAYQIENKDYKKPNANYLGGRDFWDAYLNSRELPFHNGYKKENIFISREQVGIARKDKIVKEEAVSAGVRRIKAVLEK